MKIKVAVVVLNWNSVKDTAACIASLRLMKVHGDTTFDILLIDNGSTEAGTKSYLDSQTDSNIHVLKNQQNLGFAGGVNTGINHAIKNGFTHVALINNDAVVDEQWLEQLITAQQQTNAGICTGLLLDRAGVTIDSSGEQYSIWGLAFPRNRLDETSSAPASGLTFGATGGASLYSVGMLKKIGLFDERFFAYYEDVDISFRAQLHGYEVYYCAQAIAYHARNSTSKRVPGLTVYQTFKNLPLLIVKNVPRGLLYKILPRFWLAYLLMLGKTVSSKTFSYAIRGFVASLWHSVRSIPARLTIQRSKIVETSYIENIMWPGVPPLQEGLKKLVATVSRRDRES